MPSSNILSCCRFDVNHSLKITEHSNNRFVLFETDHEKTLFADRPTIRLQLIKSRRLSALYFIFSVIDKNSIVLPFRLTDFRVARTTGTIFIVY